MNILVACEESQRVCMAFREKGHRAFSCDIEPCSGGHPEWHIQGDCLSFINGAGETTDDFTSFFETTDGSLHKMPEKWDMIIAFPPCTYLCVSGNAWFNVEKYGVKAKQRYLDRYRAIVFFMQIANADCERIAIENPIGIMSSAYRQPNQIIQPYMFGDPFEKKTCLWLKNLPLLTASKECAPPERKHFASGNTMPEWYADLWKLPQKERAKQRSKTFPGIAQAMADQWG